MGDWLDGGVSGVDGGVSIVDRALDVFDILSSGDVMSDGFLRSQATISILACGNVRIRASFAETNRSALDAKRATAGHPRLRKSCAIAKPIPRLAPVMRAERGAGSGDMEG